MSRSRRLAAPVRSLIAGLVLSALAGGASGCSDAVDPTLGTDEVYTLWGTLDPTSTRQAIRVVPIDDRINAPLDSALDATITTTDLGTGIVTTWRDSLVTYEDGSGGHVFVSDAPLRPNALVRFQAENAEGGTASVQLEIPPVRPLRLLPAERVFTEVVYTFQIKDVPRLQHGQIEFVVVTNGQTRSLRAALPEQPRPTADGWEVSIPFTRFARQVLRNNGILGRPKLLRVTYESFVSHADWIIPPGGLDSEVIVEPGTYSNIEGGFGFVGAGYPVELTWQPSIGTQRLAGFDADGEAAEGLVINEVPVGTEQWVEFYNPTLEPIDLASYTVSHSSGEAIELPFGTVVPALGHLAIDVPMTFVAGDAVSLISPQGSTQISTLTVHTARGASFGSYPDGRALEFAAPNAFANGPDLFRGPLSPTRGQPNLPHEQPAVLNEISPDGRWVEVVRSVPPGLTLEAAYVTAEPEDVVEDDLIEASGFPYAVADDVPLDPSGGDMILVVEYRDAVGQRYRQAVDHFVFEPIATGATFARSPDGPGGDWRTDLPPSRGTFNTPLRQRP